MHEHGVSDGTVKRAIGILRDEGRMRTVTGKVSSLPSTTRFWHLELATPRIFRYLLRMCVLVVLMANGGLPDWWTYPTRCGNGHDWGPGRVIVSWMPCLCDPAREAQQKGSGHRVIVCRTPGCGFEVYEPWHDPGSA